MISIAEFSLLKRSIQVQKLRNLFNIKKKQNKNNIWKWEIKRKLISDAEVSSCFENNWIGVVKLVSADDFCFNDFVVDNFDSLHRVEAIRICFVTGDLVDVVANLQCWANLRILNQRSIWVFKWNFVSPLLDNQEVTKHLLLKAKCLWWIQISFDRIHRPSASLHSPVQSEYGHNLGLNKIISKDQQKFFTWDGQPSLSNQKSSRFRLFASRRCNSFQL